MTNEPASGHVWVTSDGNLTILAGNNGVDNRGGRNGNIDVHLTAKNGTLKIESGRGQKIDKYEGDGIRIEGYGSVEASADIVDIYAHDAGLFVHQLPSKSATIKAENSGMIKVEAKTSASIHGDKNGVEIGDNGTQSISVKTSAGGNTVTGGTAAIRNAGTGTITIEAGSFESPTRSGEGYDNIIGYSNADDDDGLSKVGVRLSKVGVRSEAAGTTDLLATRSNSIRGEENGIWATNGTVNVFAAAGKNEVSAGSAVKDEQENAFGQAYAIRAETGAQVSLAARDDAPAKENQIFGAVYASSNANDANTSSRASRTDGANTSVKLRAAQNKVFSNTVIKGAGDLTDEKKVISALYAEGRDAEIYIQGKNEIGTYADSSDESQLERSIWAFDGASITIDGWSSIHTDRYETSPTSLDIAVAAGTRVDLTAEEVKTEPAERAVATINYDNDEKGAASQIVGDIFAAYAGEVNIKPMSTQARIHIKGNVLAGNNGIVNLNLGQGGTLTGRIDDYGDAGSQLESPHGDADGKLADLFNPAFSSTLYQGGIVNLTMGAGSRWNVTGQSWVTKIVADSNLIDGEHTPVIDLTQAQSSTASTMGHALTIYEMEGNSVFNVSLNANRSASDMIYLKKAKGEYLINIVDAVTPEDMYAGGHDGLRFATVGAGSDVAFRAVTADSGVINVEYEIETDAYNNNKENDDYNGATASEGKPGSDSVDEFFSSNATPGTETAAATLSEDAAAGDNVLTETTNFKLVSRRNNSVSDAGRTVINMSRANYANAVYLDTLNKRQGEMRFSAGKEDGLWARVRYDSIGKKDAFDIDNTMVEVGWDGRSRKDSGEFHTGLALDYMTGDTDYDNVTGDGNIDRYGAWLYTTWLGDEGEYYDVVLKYGRLKNDFTIYAKTTGERIKGDYDNDVLSASFEAGRKYANEKRWYVEPQVQLQYAYVTSADYKTSQGSKVELDSIQSLIARAGLRLGKDVDAEKPMTFYVRGDIMHEFLGEQKIEAHDRTGTLDETYQNKGTWYSAGAGVSLKTAEDFYVFFEAEKVFGHSNDGSYTLSGGMKYFF